MQVSVGDLKTFYSDLIGRIVRRIVRTHIHDIWPDCKGLRVMGFGYAPPYLKLWLEEAERVFAVMPRAMGVHHWPEGSDNLVCLSEEPELPIETNSVDRIIIVHSMEFSDAVDATYEELWRILKSTGRMLVIVPNRLGFWSRADWTPFGQGTPYSATQVRRLLAEHKFVHEHTRKILYVPPFRSSLFIRSAQMFESMGQYMFPALCGLHMVEVSKQIYASRGLSAAEKIRAKAGAGLPAGASNRIRHQR